MTFLSIALISLFFGFVTFPILFKIQHLLKLPIPALSDTIHIHHSFYGLLLILMGGFLFFFHRPFLAIATAAYGFGWIIHHVYSEPHLKGIGNFIYFPSKKNSFHP